MDNFRIMYRILKYLEEAMDEDVPDTNQITHEKLGITQRSLLEKK